MGVERDPGREPDAQRGVEAGSGLFFGYDISGMSPKVQILIGFCVLLPTLIASGFALLLGPAIFVFLFFSSLGWTVPAAALMMRGIAGLRDSRPAGLGDHGSRTALGASGAGERAVLKVLRENGEMSAARAAAEASLTAAEADEILSRLAGDGHLRLRIRGVGLFYSLWETRVDGDESGEFGAF